MKLIKGFSRTVQWNRHKALLVLVILAFIAVPTGVLAYWWSGTHVAQKTFTANVDPGLNIKINEETEHFLTPPNRLNVILLGVDERPKENDPGRSDTLVVMMVDTLTREVAVLSVPRDTRVRVKGLGWDKINHAFMVGGVTLAQQTAENFLGVSMDYYAKVDMGSFGRVVDAIGGITIDVEKRMQYEDTWEHFIIDLKPGIQRLDGRTALQYVRYRDEEGDIGRVRRQQNFFRAVLAEMNTPGIILKLPGIIREVFAAIDSNMPLPMMLALAHQLKDGLSVGFKTNMVDGLPYYIDDISYWIPDVMKTRQKVAEMQGISFSGNTKTSAQQMADEYWQSLPTYARLDDGSHYSDRSSEQVKAKPLPPEQKVTATPIRVQTVSTSPAPITPHAIPKATISVNKRKDLQ